MFECFASYVNRRPSTTHWLSVIIRYIDRFRLHVLLHCSGPYVMVHGVLLAKVWQSVLDIKAKKNIYFHIRW